MQGELQKKLALLIKENLKDEEQSIKDLVLTLLDTAMKKEDIKTMENAVKLKLDAEILKRYSAGILDYDEDDDSFDVM